MTIGLPIVGRSSPNTKKLFSAFKLRLRLCGTFCDANNKNIPLDLPVVGSLSLFSLLEEFLWRTY